MRQLLKARQIARRYGRNAVRSMISARITLPMEGDRTWWSLATVQVGLDTYLQDNRTAMTPGERAMAQAGVIEGVADGIRIILGEPTKHPTS